MPATIDVSDDFGTSEITEINKDGYILVLNTVLTGLEGRLVRPIASLGSECSLVVKQDGVNITLNEWPVWAEDMPNVSFSHTTQDIFNHDGVSQYLFDTDIRIHDQGFLNFTYFSLHMKQCKLIVESGGRAQFGVLTTDLTGKTVTSRGCVLILENAGYGSDNYRKVGLSIAGDGGFLTLANTTVHMKGTVRNDFDLHPNSKVCMYDTTITGTPTSYHHFASKNAVLINVTVEDAFSVEFMETPIEVTGMNTVSCATGLSFYSSEPHVFVNNLNVSNAKNAYLKRNNAGCLRLVDSFIPAAAIMTGRAAVQSSFSHWDSFVVGNSPVSDAEVLYVLSDNLVIYNKDGANIRLRGIPVQSQVFQGSTICFVKDGDTFDAGNAFTFNMYTVTGIGGQRDLILDRTPEETDVSAVAIVVVEHRISDERGEAGKVLIPSEFIEFGKSVRVPAPTPRRYWRHLGAGVATKGGNLPVGNHKDIIDISEANSTTGDAEIERLQLLLILRGEEMTELSQTVVESEEAKSVALLELHNCEQIITTLNDQQVTTQTRVLELEAEVASIDADLQDEKATSTSLNSEITDLTARTSTMESEINVLNQKVTEIGDARSEALLNLSNCEEKIISLNDLKNTAETRALELQEEVSSIQTELQEEKDRSTSLNSEITDLTAGASTAASEINALYQQVTEIGDAKSDALLELSNCEQQIISLNDLNNTTQTRALELEEEVSSIQAELQEEKDISTSLNSQITDLTAGASTAESEIIVLTQKVTEINDARLETMLELSNVEEELSSKQAELHDEKHKSTSLGTENTTLKISENMNQFTITESLHKIEAREDQIRKLSEDLLTYKSANPNNNTNTIFDNACFGIVTDAPYTCCNNANTWPISKKDEEWVPMLSYTMLGVIHNTFFKQLVGKDAYVFVPNDVFISFSDARGYMNQFMLHAMVPFNEMQAWDKTILARWQLLPKQVVRTILNAEQNEKWCKICVQAAII
jgi:predicted  nucleic acid-binding Zn-ribbon protein